MFQKYEDLLLAKVVEDAVSTHFVKIINGVTIYFGTSDISQMLENKSFFIVGQ